MFARYSTSKPTVQNDDIKYVEHLKQSFRYEYHLILPRASGSKYEKWKQNFGSVIFLTAITTHYITGSKNDSLLIIVVPPATAALVPR